MPQETTNLTTGSIKQNVAANGGELVRPNDNTTVFATDKYKFEKAGTEIEVHVLLAEKLIAAGKATAEKQGEEPKKKDK